MELPIPENSPLTEALLEDAIVSLTDINGKIIFVNDNFCTITGYSKDEIIGNKHSLFKSGKQSDAVYKHLWETISTGNTWKGELCNRHKNGNFYHIDATITPIHDDNNTKYYFAINHDITTQKQLIESSQKRAQQQSLLSILGQQSILGTITVQFFIEQVLSVILGVLDLHMGCIIEKANQNNAIILAQHGLDQASYTTNIVDSEFINLTLQTPSPLLFQHNQLKDYSDTNSFFSTNDISTFLTCRIGEKENLVGVLALFSKEDREFSQNDKDFIHSVSNLIANFILKKRIEKALNKEKETSQKYLDIVDVIILALNKNGNIILANKKAADILDYSQDELMGMNWFNHFIPIDNREKLKIYFEKFFSPELNHGRLQQKLQNHTNTIITKDGSQRVIKWNNTLFYENGNPVSTLSSGEDITEFIAAQKEKEALQKELIQAQKLEAIGLLTSGIAHDFNNILASILGFSSLAIEKFAPEGEGKLYEYLHEIDKAGIRARNIISQLLNYSQDQENKLRAVYLPAIVEDTLTMLRSAIPTTMDFKQDIDSSVPAALTDPSQLNQVIMNLLLNARDAMEYKGTVTIKVSEHKYLEDYCDACHEDFSGHYVELAISDTGKGIHHEHLDKIFDTHFTTKEKDKGYGVGLSNVNKIVHESGGHIAVDTSDKGTTFRILYKTAKGKNNTETQLEQKGIEAPIDTNKHIMIVDDENSITVFMSELFSQIGFTVSSFIDPTQALSKFIKSPETYDLLITDQTMPALTGAELATALLKVKPDLPIILMTGHSDIIDEDKAHELNIKGFLKKPVPTHELLECVYSLLKISE